VLAARRDDARARQVSLVPAITPAAAAGDRGLAERLIANLVDNAIRYNTTGGRVAVSVGTRAGRPFLAVANTGPVIPPEEMARLFRPFQRMDPARRAPGGLGLGLAIVGAIAAAHGAELRALTRVTGGLAIEIVFPPPAWREDPGSARPTMDHALGGVRDQPEPGPRPGPVPAAL
jgi:signal transduction histidine kinase